MAILNNPFYYEPHPLCVEAAHSVIADIKEHPEWSSEIKGGKTFGVLIVEGDAQEKDIFKESTIHHIDDKYSWVAAYSGQMIGSYNWDGYVPAVFDYLEKNGIFKQHEAEIVEINKEIDRLSSSAECSNARNILYKVEQEKPVAPPPSKEINFPTREEWVRQRQFEKAEHHRAKLRWKTRVEEAQYNLQIIQEHITSLKQERRKRSDVLQHWLFKNFEMLNIRAEKKNLLDIFTEWAQRTGSKCIIPPSGSGECCAPKLLQFAFRHHLKPIAIAEFSINIEESSESAKEMWSPQWRGACDSRCKPILDWMLEGIEVASNPLEEEEERTEVSIIYEDEEIIAINKPAGMLSVPGKSGRKSALDILRNMRPDIPELMMAHRLDMQTSGVLIASKTLQKYKELQHLFLNHEHIQKTYVAVLEGILPLPVGTRGRISLPLSADFINRPRQKVDHEQGKTAISDYEVLAHADGHTRLRLSPITGRTHQLRLHCASAEGLSMPILGDDLYGKHADRLYLHAQSIIINGKTIEAKDAF